MNTSDLIARDCIIPDDAVIEQGVSIGPRTILAGPEIVLRSGARLDPACVIAEAVTIGQGAWVRAGAVVLRSVPPNAIVEGNPATIVGYRSSALDKSSRRPDPRHFDLHQCRTCHGPIACLWASVIARCI